MSMYKKAYYNLFNSITDVIKIIEDGNNMDRGSLIKLVEDKLKDIQADAEEIILGDTEEI